jgi:hypothetical protein
LPLDKREIIQYIQLLILVDSILAKRRPVTKRAGEHLFGEETGGVCRFIVRAAVTGCHFLP